MTILQAIVLGIVQGLTEFLPISSTAHLRIVPALLGWGDPGAAFTAVIQLGTLAAVLIYFARDVRQIGLAVAHGIVRGRPLETTDARLGWKIAVGTIPIVVCGLLLRHAIEGEARSLYVIATSLIALALLLAAAERFVVWSASRGAVAKELADVSWIDTIVIGLAQAVALIPGSSRSGTTITGALFRGLSRHTAARFSFLLSLPSIFAAGMLELYEYRRELLESRDQTAALLIATVVSGLVGYASIAFLLQYLRTRTTWVFILYRLVLGAVLFALLSAGVLKGMPKAPQEATGPGVQVQVPSGGSGALDWTADAIISGCKIPLRT